MCYKAQTTLSCTTPSVARARRWASAELPAMYRQAGEVTPDIQVVVSELVTNAVRAKCRHLTLALEGHHRYVRVAATDDAPGTPVKQTPAPDQTHGRGLSVVDALSSRWGVDRAGGDKTVWADVSITAGLEPTFACAT